MDKKKMIAMIVAVLVAIGGMVLGIDLKGAVCGAPAAEQAK